MRTKCYVGKSNWAADGILDAHLDDLKIFSRVLDQEEIEREKDIRRPFLN